jgi:dipeptidyl aminopeptidase/acylaminoacyl peptidase
MNKLEPHRLGGIEPSSAMVALGRRLTEVRMRPDGNAVGWIQRGVGPAELVVKQLSSVSGTLIAGPEIVMTNRPGPFAAHPDGGGAWCWSPDSQFIVFCGPGGLWMIASTGGLATQIVTPVDGRHVWSPCISRDGRLIAFVDESDDDAFVCVAPIDQSWLPRRVSESDSDFVMDPDWGADGLLAWHSWSVPHMAWDKSRIDLASINADGDVVARARRESDGSVGQPRWCGPALSTSSAHLLSYTDDASGWSNVHSVEYTSELELSARAVTAPPKTIDPAEHNGPTWGPGQRTTAWCPDGTAIAFDRNESGFGRLCVKDLGGLGEHVAVTQLGRGIHLSLSWATTTDGTDRIAAIRHGATTPRQIVIYERASNSDSSHGTWSRTVIALSSVAGWNVVDLVEPSATACIARDGTTIHGRVYRPPNGTGPLPTLVSIHGGPTGQTRVEWNARFAAYVAAGWQVFVPDHRGTTGWGRAYQQAMNERWGEVDVTDVVDAVKSMCADGSADPTCLIISGGSAGGFTVLSVLLAEPTLFSGGIALYPVTDLIALDETTHRFEAHYQQTLVGQRPEHEQRYIDRSPFHLVVTGKDAGSRCIEVPLLLFHGTEDRVVSIAQSDVLVEVLRNGSDSDVEYVRFDGEGHGWSNPETTMVEHQKVMNFLATIVRSAKLGG